MWSFSFCLKSNLCFGCVMCLLSTGMADIQCLAVHSEGGKTTSLYDKIILRKVENQSFFEQDLPHFLPPAIFSRLDTPVDYFYRPDVHQRLMTG